MSEPMDERTQRQRQIDKIQQDLQELIERPLSGVTVDATEYNGLNKWLIRIFGRPHGVHHGAYFKAWVEFPDDYPSHPPKLFFSDPFPHPNIASSTGKRYQFVMRIPILGDEWQPDIGMRQVIKTVIATLVEPDTSIMPANRTSYRRFINWLENDDPEYLDMMRFAIADSVDVAIEDGLPPPRTVEEFNSLFYVKIDKGPSR